MLGAVAPLGAAPPPPIEVEYYFEAGCDACETLRREVLPEVAVRYPEDVTLQPRDIGVESNYLRLVAWQQRFGAVSNEPVSMVVAGQVLLQGVRSIRGGLFEALDAALARRPPAGTVTPGAATPAAGVGDPAALARRVRGFTWAAVLAAAVVDSLNPCAVATLVFFMSLLTVAHIGVRRMWLAGLAFLAAVYMTYLAIGFGLWRLLGWLVVIRHFRVLLDGAMVLVLAGLAFLSFRDAIRFRRTGRSEDVALKLPGRVQARIHAVLRGGLRRRHLVAGGFGAGVVVTVLESVCTGQVYVPALVLTIRQGESAGRCLAYLLAYNAVFVTPLLVVLALTCAGLGTPALVAWSRRNGVIGKTLLGLFFVGMAALLLVL